MSASLDRFGVRPSLAVRVNPALNAALLLSLLTPRLLSATGFISPRQLSETGGTVVQATAGVDLSFNAYIVWTTGTELRLTIIGLGSTKEVTLSEPDRPCGDPVIVTNSTGTTFIAYAQLDPATRSRDIFLANNRGGGFSSKPVNLSKSPADDYAPRIALDAVGEPHVVWASQAGNSAKVFYSAPGKDPIGIARGDYPSVAASAADDIYVVYIRGRDVYSVNNRAGTFGAETAVTRTPLDDEWLPSIAVADQGSIFAAYERRASLYYHTSSDNGVRFGSPRLLDAGGVTTPEIRVTGDPFGGELLSIAYEKAGDLYFIRGKVGETLASAIRVVETPEIETRPSLAVDARGSLHLSFIRDGEVYYTNNSDELTSEFAATPTSGEVPLRVQFTSLAGGPVEQYVWDFGDDSPASFEPNPVHVYTVPEKYNVSLRVLGTGRQSVEEKTSYIFVQTPNNRLWIPDQVVFPSQQGVWFPIMGFHKAPLQGFEVVGTFDPSILQIQSVTYAESALVDTLVPEFWGPSLSNDPAEPYFYAGVIFDFKQEYDGQTLPPSTNAQRLIHLVTNVSDDAPQGGTTILELQNRVGPGELHNVFAIDGFGALPLLKSSVVTILEVDVLPQVFKRGDVDWNRDVDLTDAINILGYLFLGGTSPLCLDAADTDDSGSVDIADSIALLGYLFTGATAPAVPYPNFGLDPSEDELDVCKRP